MLGLLNRQNVFALSTGSFVAKSKAYLKDLAKGSKSNPLLFIGKPSQKDFILVFDQVYQNHRVKLEKKNAEAYHLTLAEIPHFVSGVWTNDYLLNKRNSIQT